MTGPSGFAFNDQAGLWVATWPIGLNPGAEIVLPGDAAAIESELADLLALVESTPGEPSRMATELLTRTVAFDEPDWFTDGYSFQVGQDGEPEVVVELSSERDVYGFWEVACRRYAGTLAPIWLKRTQQ